MEVVRNCFFNHINCRKFCERLKKLILTKEKVLALLKSAKMQSRVNKPSKRELIKNDGYCLSLTNKVEILQVKEKTLFLDIFCLNGIKLFEHPQNFEQLIWLKKKVFPHYCSYCVTL